ncbi:MAG TPA: hypothetical protein VI756_05685 [Blastocatellia bacterium]
MSGKTKLILILIPIGVVALDAALMINRTREKDPERAVRLVMESKSRIESFNIQQYLDSTLYHRHDIGENVSIEGWRAEAPATGEGPVTVEFVYTENGVAKDAKWEVDLKAGTISTENEEAAALSWDRK